jgi:MSHA biogenesis protein MshI
MPEGELLKRFVQNVVNLVRRSHGQNQCLGVEFTTEGVAFAHILRPATQLPHLVHCEFLPVEAGQQATELLQQRLAKLGLQSIPCNLVMANGTYQMLLGEAPKVPQAELPEALRWRVKDLVQFPIADAVIDAILLPEDSAKGTSRMAYAVVTQRKNIETLVAQAKAAGLVLNAIDIPEMALRNLVEACCDTKRGIALVKLVQGGGSLQIIRDGNLYLSRQFSLSYNAGLLDDLPADALILDLQRSLDYFERQMRQVPPSHVYLCGENVTPDKLTPAIRAGLPVAINTLELTKGLDIDPGVAEHHLSLCLNALGAALRQDAVGG